MLATVKEFCFIYQLLKEMRGFSVELPITVRVDNISVIFMAENMQVSQRTKHIDTCLRFVNQYVNDGFIKIKFIGMNANDACSKHALVHPLIRVEDTDVAQL